MSWVLVCVCADFLCDDTTEMFFDMRRESEKFEELKIAIGEARRRRLFGRLTRNDGGEIYGVGAV
jgi:hypothetical protein